MKKDSLSEKDIEKSAQAIKLILEGKDEINIPISALNALYNLGDWLDAYRSKMEQKRRRDWPSEYKK